MTLSVISSVGEILDRVATRVRDDAHWAKRLGDLQQRARKGTVVTVHLAVFVEPYFGFILDGTKTVESRFSINRCAPFRQVSIGDLLLIKRSGGGVAAICEIGSTAYYDLDATAFASIREKFSKQLAITDEEFWRSKRQACYASLFRVRNVRAIDTVNFVKRDRRGWVVFRTRADSRSGRVSSPAADGQTL